MSKKSKSKCDVVERLRRKVRRVREARERIFSRLANEIREEMDRTKNPFTKKELYLLLEPVSRTDLSECVEISKLLRASKIRRIK